MLPYLTGDDLFAYLLLLRDVDKRTVLLLEGPDDCAALDVHLDDAECQSLPGYGKKTVLGAIALVESQEMPRVVAILDSDLESPEEEIPAQPSIIYTDYYDLDATIYFSGTAFHRVVSNFADKEKTKAYLAQRNATSLLDLGARIAGAIGQMRQLSINSGRHIPLRELPLAKVLNVDSLEIDARRLAQVIHSKTHRLNLEEVENLIARALMPIDIRLQQKRSSGHDLTAVLSYILRDRCGAKIGQATLSRALRASWSCAELARTRMYTAVANWSHVNNTKVWSCPN